MPLAKRQPRILVVIAVGMQKVLGVTTLFFQANLGTSVDLMYNKKCLCDNSTYLVRLIMTIHRGNNLRHSVGVVNT